VVDGNAIHYVAAPGETNDVVVGEIDANTMTVRDGGAVIDAQSGCEPNGLHQARCTAPAGLVLARVDTGDLNDRIRSFDETDPIVDPALVANGGPGDDELIGGESDDSLDGGGGGIDRLLGATGDDTLTDGDTSGSADADVLVGGPEMDTLLYDQRTRPVSLVLDDERTHGERGEGDSISTIENVETGSGADRLRGDAHANVLSGGRGVDSVFCGGGIDLALVSTRRDFVASDCERASMEGAGFIFTARPYPARWTVRGPIFRLGCPSYFDEGRAGRCSGKLTLRETRGRSRLLGSGLISKRTKAANVGVKLKAIGNRLARRRGGVLAVVTLKGKRLPSIGWTIRLRP
jgi:Ca2+-binding RTX toxin-like protein